MNLWTLSIPFSNLVAFIGQLFAKVYSSHYSCARSKPLHFSCNYSFPESQRLRLAHIHVFARVESSRCACSRSAPNASAKPPDRLRPPTPTPVPIPLRRWAPLRPAGACSASTRQRARRVRAPPPNPPPAPPTAPVLSTLFHLRELVQSYFTVYTFLLYF